MMRWQPLLGSALALLSCLAVFSFYLQPDFMVQLADQLWSCF